MPKRWKPRFTRVRRRSPNPTIVCNVPILELARLYEKTKELDELKTQLFSQTSVMNCARRSH